MGYTTEHMVRRRIACVPDAGQFLKSICIRTNQSAALTERNRWQHKNPDTTTVKQCRRNSRKGNYIRQLGKV